MKLKKISTALFACSIALSASISMADEGMWTMDNPPTKILQQRYKFTPEKTWLDHLRLSSVRFMDGGSGSFASAHGLVVTNHHVAAGQLQKMSTPKHNYMATGFYAKELKDEIKCPDLEVNVLVSLKDVTSDVMSVLKPGMKPQAAIKARDAKKASMEKKCMDKPGIKCEVVSLYQGGQYWLYKYRKYTDIRLVFAPERQAAFFGGDWDNFTYPRYDLDVAFFRVYDNGKPLDTKDWLKWDPEGVKNGELVFITGHPGRTSRLYSVKQLEVTRDIYYPMILNYIDRALKNLAQYAKQGKEQQRQALIYQFMFANGQKALSGEYKGLKSPELMAQKAQQEKTLRDKVNADPKLKKKYADAWTSIERIYRKYGKQLKNNMYRTMFRSGLISKAITIVKYVQEVKKPDADRLDGFHDSDLEALRFRLLSPAPVYPGLEAVLMATAMGLSLDNLPAKDPWAKILRSLGDPKEAALKLCSSTKLKDPAYRKKLLEGGMKAVEKSDDPMIVLARKLVPIMIKDEKWRKKTIESVTTPAKEKIAKARFAIYGTDAYPDATFTLRMTFGSVKGYPMNGTKAPYQTTLFGLYDRNLGFDNQGGWNLPERFFKQQKYLNLKTQVNFVSDCDIIGGNSGSPVVNKEGQLVGVVFDGNIESLSGRFIFDQEHSRAVAVSSQYVLHALRKLYDAADLADEITQ